MNALRAAGDRATSPRRSGRRGPAALQLLVAQAMERAADALAHAALALRDHLLEELTSRREDPGPPRRPAVPARGGDAGGPIRVVVIIPAHTRHRTFTWLRYGALEVAREGGRGGWDEPTVEVAVTVSQLYALYRAGYEEAWRASDGGLLRPHEITVTVAGTSDLERLVLELALLDATNGTPPRSRHGFGRAVAQGADVLVPLGLRLDREAGPGDPMSVEPSALDEAA